MEKVLTFSDSDQFYHQLLEMESRREEYRLDTGVLEVKALPLRLLNHVGIAKDEIAHLQHKALAENVWFHEYLEPVLEKFNLMTGRYQPARDYEFTVETGDYETIKFHGRPKDQLPL
jgi:hypothetical protein